MGLQNCPLSSFKGADGGEIYPQTYMIRSVTYSQYKVTVKQQHLLTFDKVFCCAQ